MSDSEVSTVLTITVSLGLLVVGIAALMGRIDLTLAQRSARASMTASQRRRALRQIRGGEPTDAADREHVRAVAAGLASPSGFVLVFGGFALISVGQVLGSSPPWLLVPAGVAAAGNLVITVALAYDYRRAHRFLATQHGLKQKARR